MLEPGLASQTESGSPQHTPSSLDGRIGPTGQLLATSLLAQEFWFRDSGIPAGTLDRVTTSGPREDWQTGRRKLTKTASGEGDSCCVVLLPTEAKRPGTAPRVTNSPRHPENQERSPKPVGVRARVETPSPSQKSLLSLTKNPLTAREGESQRGSGWPFTCLPCSLGQRDDDSDRAFSV